MSTMDPPKGEGEPEKPAIPTGSIGTPTAASQHPPPSPLSGCYLLVVLPEPHNAQHKDLILNRIAKGFLSWDKDNCHVDLEKELHALVAQAPEGEEARNGERLIQYATENLVTEILIHPQTNTLLQCIRNLLASFTKHRHIIHAGYTFSENGSWILQDGTFSLADFLDAFNEHDVQRVLRAYENSVTVDINCAAIGEWSTQRLSKEPCTRTCRVRLNPDDVLTAGAPAITNFTNYISQYLVPQTLDELMQPSDVVGNIRFSHPTLYVFPGGQGDAALFGINGFNMLVDGGFARKSCFWDFTRHLDRLDAVLLTRINNSNIGGMSSVLRKKHDMQVYPQIGHFFCNLVERKHSNSPDGDKDLDPLILSLTELGQEMMLNLKHINLRAHPCYRDPEPINLYHKVGHGTLDMYVLSPSKDSREVREFLLKWSAGDFKLFAGSHKKDSNNLTFPIQNMISICALLVWQPANPEDTITRILFPGSTPQQKIFEGIERLRHLEFLKHPTCTAKSISPSASLVALKDKPMKISKISLIDRETKRAGEIRKAKREEESKQKIELTPVDKVDEKPKPIPKKREVVEDKKIDDIKEIGVKDVKKEKEVKEVKEVKKIVKEDVKKTDVIKTKQETEKTAATKEKAKPERKKKEVTKEVQKVATKPKAEAPAEKKVKATPPAKKPVNGVAKPEEKAKPAVKSAAKPAAKTLPAAAPKSAKDANNRKVVEQKNIERMSMSKAPAKPKASAPPPEKKPVPRRAKPALSPSKGKFVGGSPIKSAKSTPTASVKSDKDGVLRKIKTEKGTADSSTVSTPSAIEIDSINKFTDKCLTEKSEDMSLDSIESKVLADLKEERQVVEEIEAVLQKAERIEGARKGERVEGEDEVTGEATDKKDITEDMTEDDVTADIDEVPRKSPSRKASQEQLTEEEDEYLIIEKEEGDTEDSVHSGEAEHKHFLDAAQSEKEKILKDSDEYEEKEAVDEEELEPEELEEEEEEDEEEEEEDEGEEKEVAEEKGIMEEREKSDDASERKAHGEIEKTLDKENIPIAEYKEQLEEEMKGIITSATEMIQKADDKDDSGKKDSEDLTKEVSSMSPEKLDSSEKKTTDTDIKPEIEKIKEKMEESQERISTVESGATTTAPTLPEDERMSLETAKPIPEKPEEKKIEIPVKPKEIIPLTTEPSEVKPEVRIFNVRQGPQALQRDIVKTPDEVADLPVHEEVDPKLYKMEDFEKGKEEKAQVSASAPQEIKESTGKDHKGVFAFFGKVADKFEKGMDKLTRKGRRDSEKDIDEKSSKSGSPQEERRRDSAVIPEVEVPKAEDKKEKSPAEHIDAAKIEPAAVPAPKSPQIEEKAKMSLEALDKSAETLDTLEDADEVEALLEEASKKFKTVKDSLRDSLESLEEKIAEEEFKRASELSAAIKDGVKDTLEEVVEKLEEIKPQIDKHVVESKEPEKVQFTMPDDLADEDEEEVPDEEGEACMKDVKEAVREVGEVLAGTAGINLDEKPKDVIEIVKKVAEVLKEDDFLSEKVLFEASAEASKEEEKPEECKEEPCIKSVIERPASPAKDELMDKVEAMIICGELMKEESPTHERVKRSLVDEEEKIDVMEAGLEEVCQKVEAPKGKRESPEPETKEERRDSLEIKPSEISMEHKISPTTAEHVIVTPDSVPPSPKFSDNLQSTLEKTIITSELPKSGLPEEIESIITSAKTIDDIIEQLVFIKHKKITIEIIEYIILIKRVPREQIIHVIEEIIIRKKVPRESVVDDTNVLELDASEKKKDGMDDKGKEIDTKEEAEEEADSLLDDKEIMEVESEILNEYVTKGKKITRVIVEEIHVKRRVPIHVIIEIIEQIIIKRKVRKQSIVDINDADWEALKTEHAEEEEEEEGKSIEEDQQPEDFVIIPSAEEVENIHLAESEILDNYISKGKKITRVIIEEIHVKRRIPIHVIIEIIEKIIITKKLRKQSIVDIPETVWADLKVESHEDEKPEASEKAQDGFEAVEQEYKFSGPKDEKVQEEKGRSEVGEAVEDDMSDVVEADEKLMDKSRPSVTLDEKIMTEVEEKGLVDRKLSGGEVLKDKVEAAKVSDDVESGEDKETEPKTVRRMIVTATSEDGGDETVICPAGSITFGKSITPEDSLRGSPVKGEPDKDSLHSRESTPEKESISAKDSLEKSPTSVRDSQTLDDSIEKSKIDDKTPEVEAEAKEESKDLHLGEIDKKSPDFDRTEDASPAESVFAVSPLKESAKTDVVDAKPIPDEKTKEEPKKEASPAKSPMPEAEHKEIIDVTLDKSRSSSTASLAQEEKVPVAIDTSRKDSTLIQEPIKADDKEAVAHDEITKTPITAPSSDDIDLSCRKESLVDLEKDKSLTGLTSKIDDKLDEKVDADDAKADDIDKKGTTTGVLHEESAISEIALPLSETIDKTLDLKVEDEAVEKKSPSSGIEREKSSLSRDISPSRKASIVPDEKKEEKKESSPISTTSPIRKESIVQEKDKLDESLSELKEKEVIQDSISPREVLPTQEESFVQEKEKLGEVMPSESDKKLPSSVVDVKIEKSTEDTSVRKDSIAMEEKDKAMGISLIESEKVGDEKLDKGDEKTSPTAESIKSSASPRDISPIRKESLAGDKDVLVAQAIDDKKVEVTLEDADKKSTSPSIEDAKSTTSGDISPVRKESLAVEDVKDAVKDDGKSPTPSVGDVKSAKSSREPSPTRKDSLPVGHEDLKEDVKTEEKKSPAPSIGDAKSVKSSRETSPVRKESLVVEPEEVKADAKDDDKKSPAKSPVASRDTSPIRKESLAVGKLEEAKVDEKAPSPVATSPIKKESILPDEKEKSLEKDQPEDTKAASPVTAASPVREESLKPEEKISDMDSSKSPAVFPEKKESIVLDEKVLIGKPEDKKEDDTDLKAPSPAESVKSSASTRDASPARKETVAIDKKVSASPRASIDIKPEDVTDKQAASSLAESKKSSRDSSPVRKESSAIEKLPSETAKDSLDLKPEELGDGKSASPIAESVKSSASPRDLSPIRKESVIPDEKAVDGISRASIDLKLDELGLEQKTPSPVAESVKSSASPRESSPIREESMVHEEKPSDIKPEKSLVDKKPPSPVAESVKSSASPRETSPIREESIVPKEKASASPRASIDIKPEEVLHDEKKQSPITESVKSASPRDTSPVRKDSAVQDTISSTPTASIDVRPEAIKEASVSAETASETEKPSVDSKPEELEAGKKSPVTDSLKSATSPEGTSPIRKESIDHDEKVSASPRASIDVKPEEGLLDKKPSSPAESVKSASPRDLSPVRKESTIPEEKVSSSARASVDIKPEEILLDQKSASPVAESITSASPRDLSPTRKESIIHDGKVSSTPRASIDIKAVEGLDKESPSPAAESVKSTSPGDQSPARKEGMAQDEKMSASPRASIDVKPEEGLLGKKSPSPVTEGAKSASPREISPVRKESIIHEEKVSASPRASIDIKPEGIILDKTSPSAVVENVKSASPRDLSPIKKESMIPDEEVSASSRTSVDIKPEEGLIDKKSPSPVAESGKSASPRDLSPIRKESVISGEKISTSPRVSIDIKPEEGLIDKISPSPVAESIKSASPRDFSPIRKESVISDEKVPASPRASIDIKPEEGLIDKKSPSPVAESIKSASPRDLSPIRKESVISDEKVPASPRASIDIKPEEGLIDKKSPSPAAESIKSASPRDLSPIRKESVISDEKVPASPRASIDIKPEEGLIDKKSTSPVAESIKSASPRDLSPIRKESVISDEKVPASPRASIDIKPEEGLIDKKSPSPTAESIKSASPRDLSPLRKESVIPDEKMSTSPRASIDIKPEEGLIDKKSPSPVAESAKSASPQDLSPIRKESVISDEKVSASPRASIDIKPEEGLADMKSSSPVAESIKSASPRDLSPIRKDSVISDEKVPASIDIKPEEGLIDKKSSSPLDGSAKPASPQDVSQIRKESMILEEKVSASPRASIDLKPEEGLIDKKSPSPVAESAKSASPQDPSPIRKESMIHEEKVSASPRASIDLKPEEGPIDKKSPSPLAESEKSASPQDLSPIRKESLIQDAKVSTSPRASIDIKPQEILLDKASTSPVAETVKLASPRDLSPIRKESVIPDEKVSVTPRASIDIKSEEDLIDKKSPSPLAESVKSASPREVSPTRKESLIQDDKVSASPRPSIDMKPQEILIDKTSTSPVAESAKLASPRDLSPIRKESVIPEEKVSASPRASIDIKPEEDLIDKKSPSPLAESVKSLSPRDHSPIRKESLIQDEKVSASPRASIDIKPQEILLDKTSPSAIAESIKLASAREVSPTRKESIIHDEKVSASPRASIDLKPEGILLDAKSASPVAESITSASPRDLSPTRKESMIHDEKLSSTPKASIDIKPIEGLDAKSPSPVAESAKSALPHDQSPTGKESAVQDEKIPRASIDIKHDEGLLDKKPSSPIAESVASASPRELSPTRKESIVHHEEASASPRASIDIKPQEAAPLPDSTLRKESLIPEEKTSSTPRASIDMKPGESLTKEPSSSATEGIKSTSPHDLSPIKKESAIHDEKASATPKTPIDIQPEEGLDKKSPLAESVKSASPRELSPIRKESMILDEKVSASPRASIDIKPEEGLDKKSPVAEIVKSASPRDLSPVRKESIISGEKISVSPRASIDIKSDDGLLHKESQSPVAESIKSAFPQDLSPVKKESMLHDEKMSIDIKSDKELGKTSPSPIADITKSSASTGAVSPTEEAAPAIDEKISIGSTPRASIDIKPDVEIADKKAPSPVLPMGKDSESQKAVDAKDEKDTDKKSPSPTPAIKSLTSSRDASPDRKESIILDEKVKPIEASGPSEKPDDKTIEKSPTPSVVDVKSTKSSRDSSPIRKESIIHEEKEKTTEVSQSSAVSLPKPLDIEVKSEISPKSSAIDAKSSASSREASPSRKESLAPDLKDKSPEPSSPASQPLQKSEEKPVEKSPSPSGEASPIGKESLAQVTWQKSLEPSASTAQPKPDESKEAEADTTARSRSSSIASEKSGILSKKDEKVSESVPMDQVKSVLALDQSKLSPTDSTSKKSPPSDKQEEEIPEVPSRSRSRSQSLFDTGDRTPSGRSRAASLFEDKDDVVKSISRKSSGLGEFHEDHFQQPSSKIEETEDDYEVSEAKRTDIERYILSQYVNRKRKITGPMLEEIVALYDVPSYIVIETIYEICEKINVPRASIIDDVDVIEGTEISATKGTIDHMKLSQIPQMTRISIEEYITQEYIVKKKRISWKIIQEIAGLKGVDEGTIFTIIEYIIFERKIPREMLVEDDVVAAAHLVEKRAIKEEDDEEVHRSGKYKTYTVSDGGTVYYRDEHMSGKSSPERRSSGYSTPEVRHYDDKYESQFHKAFVGGMTEMRTTHITTLSGKSTPDVGTRADTPDSLPESGTSEKVIREKVGTEPTIIKRTIVTEEPEYETIVKTVVKREIVEEEEDDDQEHEAVIKKIVVKKEIVEEEEDDQPEYETVIKKTVVKREIVEEEEDDEPEHKTKVVTVADGKGAMRVDLAKSLMSSGRSTPDRIKDSSECRSSTGTPDSLRSHEIIRTTITKTRTMSDDGEITTTTKEVTETTNERGETVVLEEKTDVRTTAAEPGTEISGHQWHEEKREESDEDSPLSATSQVYHYEKGDDKVMAFTTADMSSSFYGKLPDVPQPRHTAEVVGDDKDFSFKKFTLEKHTIEDSEGKMSSSRQLADVADYDVDKVLREQEDDGDDEDEDQDPIKGWGTPLKLPSPERPNKFNLRSTPIVRASVDMSPDSLNFDVINDWGEPLRLPSPAPAADEASNKAAPTTPKKERKQPKKVIAENMKNKKRSDSPAGKERKKEMKKVQPVYLDLTYVPHHGNSYYASLEFFKRIRARYYVFSGTEPSREVYDALLDAKKTWENKKLEVTMIPTYDTDTLGYWVADNEEALAANHIDLSPSASRCTINLQDHETSCSAYRLEF